MGNVPVRSPSLAKETEYKASKEVKVAASSMRGWRPTMEDQHIICLELNGLKNHSLFAVFDGHGGGYASFFLHQNFFKVFSKQANFKQYIKLGSDSRGSVPGIELLKKTIHQTFIQLDQDLQSSDTQHRSGSTAVVVVLTPTHIVTANLGDSRAILRRDGGVLPLSFDHKPSNLPDRIRIEKTGFVKNRRVNGDLAISRAFGDFGHKPERVSVIPDFTVFPRNKRGDEFIVLACDGIWDVASNRECAQFVATMLAEGEIDLRVICEDAIDTCFDRKSRDNMTILIVGLPGMKADYSNKAKFHSAMWDTSRRANRLAESAVSTTAGAVLVTSQAISNLVKHVAIPEMTTIAVG